MADTDLYRRLRGGQTLWKDAHNHFREKIALRIGLMQAADILEYKNGDEKSYGFKGNIETLFSAIRETLSQVTISNN